MTSFVLESLAKKKKQIENVKLYNERERKNNKDFHFYL